MQAGHDSFRNVRSGKVLVLFALLLPPLLGMLGLVLDLGVVLTTDRTLQNAVDAAALAAAQVKLHGGNPGEVELAATNLIAGHDDLTGATTTVNCPPELGPHAGDDQYVEVIVEINVRTWFIQIVQGPTEQRAQARAVAGIERASANASLIALNPSVAPGLSLVGGTLESDSPIIANAEGSGFDENGQPITMTNPSPGALTGPTGTIQAPEVRVVGGVDFPANFDNAQGGASPLKAGSLGAPDPLLTLETPTTATGVINRYPSTNGNFHATAQDVTVAILPGMAVTLDPGIYKSITITGDGPATVTFNPGIYVLIGGLPTTLSIATSATVTANGVMFYNTGSGYDATTGGTDAEDGAGNEPILNETFGAITLNAPNLTLSGLDDQFSPFYGMVIYQRRRNALPLGFQAGSWDGTVYARWSSITLTASGSQKAQLIGGTIEIANLPQVPSLLLETGRRAKGPNVALVE